MITKLLGEAKSLYVSACAAEIAGFEDRLSASDIRDATITGLFSPLINFGSYAEAERNLRVRTFLLTRALKGDMALGLVEFCPWRYSMIDRWLAEPGRFDTVAVMLSPPDADGMCSLGVQADFLPTFQHEVPRIIGFINPNLPMTSGHRRVAYASLAAAVDHDVSLPEMSVRPADAVSVAIARHIAGLVPDRATVQVGTGQLPSEVLAQLGGHRGLRIHTGIVDDNILVLEAAGALDPAVPVVTGTAIGTRTLYDALSDSARFALKPVAFTHAYGSIAGTPRFTAINSVLQVDLLGQASGEAIGGRVAATPGGLPDFVRGAQDSPGGQSIIAVRARGDSGRHDGIVPLIDNPAIVTTGAVDAHIVVTEFGVANLRGLGMDRRAEAIIAIAPPEAQSKLAEAWRIMRQGFFGQAASGGLRQRVDAIAARQ